MTSAVRRAQGPNRVGLNAVFLQERLGGMETYVRHLVPELRRARPGLELVLFVNPAAEAKLSHEPWTEEVDVVAHRLIGRRPLRAASEVALLGRLSRRLGLDLLHSLAMTGPLACPVAHVVTVPDLIWLTDPDPADRLTAWVWRALVPSVARRADRVITFSDASRQEITRHLGISSEQIDVVPLGPGPADGVGTSEAALRSRLELGDGPVVLTVSAKRRHKNLLRLIRAMRVVCDQLPDSVLILPGNPTPHEAELRALAAELALERNVRLVPYVEPADLEGLYQLADCFAFPSVREGFGLPVLEAMRRGVPVVCADASSLPEVAGEAAIRFDPLDVGAQAGALLRVLRDPECAQRLARAGPARAAAFSWQVTAERTLQSYDRAWTGRTA